MPKHTLPYRFVQAALLGAAVSVPCIVSAQAPVYDVNGSNGNLEQRIEVLERMVDSRTEMQHRIQQQLDAMQGEVDELRGAVEEHTYQLEKVLERQRELYLEIDKRVEALKQGGMATGQPAGGTGSSASVPAVNQPVSVASTADEDAAYDEAVNLILKSREYDKAIPAFQSFIERFPNSEYAPNAHYWLGQLLFNKQQWADAQAEFSVVVSRFGSSSKRADAMLKLGDIAHRTGNAGQARQYYQRVVSEYPNSSASKLAESKISAL
ncbi:tol-pal system protein YbgF [Alteromonas aestuariivivens]|uniref:Cell division coordinator CpoB n=1 Tax=Alteromonas aestuariivivens TaxID=1938339 RepID=A0A3D8M7U7_9ALTE|nr:tol-pal system protein YbgF [Alteromonas aestuariivivens]RDV25242.1 tol-pal system protein YbgF [Alteromonas aestuariivivens]